MPASYPSAIKSFTTKVDAVDDVMAVDVNGLQNEVMAVETELGTLAKGGYASVRARMEALETGWITNMATWTRTSNTTFTISGDVTARFPAGTKIKVTDTMTKYFYVVSAVYGAPNTTVTITAGTDHVLSANPSERWHSYVESPQGFPPYFNFVSIVSAFSGSITSYTVQSARFVLRQFMVDAWWNVLITDNGTGAVGIFATLPINNGNAFPHGTGREMAIGGVGLIVAFHPDFASAVFVQRSDTNDYPGGTNHNLTFHATYMI